MEHEEFIHKDVACATCGWKGKLGDLRLSKHKGGIADCPKCGSPETHILGDAARDVVMPSDWVNPVPKQERN